MWPICWRIWRRCAGCDGQPARPPLTVGRRNRKVAIGCTVAFILAAIVVAAIGYYGPKLVKKGMSAVGDAIAESAQAEASWFPEEVGATVERMKDEG